MGQPITSKSCTTRNKKKTEAIHRQIRRKDLFAIRTPARIHEHASMKKPVRITGVAAETGATRDIIACCRLIQF
jgi:hypothetical protein